MKIKALVPALTLMVMLATIVFGPLGLAAAQGEFAATVTSQACTVTVSFMSVGPGTYFVEFWDDGELMDDPSQTVSGEAAQQLAFTYTFTEIGGSAPVSASTSITAILCSRQSTRTPTSTRHACLARRLSRAARCWSLCPSSRLSGRS